MKKTSVITYLVVASVLSQCEQKPAAAVEPFYYSDGSFYVCNELWHAIYQGMKMDALPEDRAAVVDNMISYVKYCRGKVEE